MEKYSRFEIYTEDKMGMALKILEKIYNEKIDLKAVEVFPKKVCVKMELMDDYAKTNFKNSILSIKEVISIKEIDLLYHERNERKLLAVINSVDEGILSANENFEIEIFNKYCENVFKYKKEEVIGKDLRYIIGENNPLVSSVKNGKGFDNIKIKFKNKKGEGHCITTGRIIKDDEDKTIGVVASIKDMDKAIELVNIVQGTHEDVFKNIVGNSPAIERVKKIVLSVSKSNSTILIMGESGTGKELFASAVRNLSDRKDKSYVAINCAAFPENLIESELFGYEKGSFTGAVSEKEGLFEKADGGTLFLDEVAELPLNLQAKLLRVLQEGVIRRIGSTKETKVDVRIIAATNKNLKEMVEKGLFREDLYYRLNVVPIYIPPLRERIEDIPLLVNFFIYKLNKKIGKKISGANIKFLEELMKYDWPGNVRELQNIIERGMNLCEGNILTTENLIFDLKNSEKIKTSQYNVDIELKLNDVVENAEKEAIVKALKRHKSFRKAAKALGVSHTTLINKVNKYNLRSVLW
ncbi:MAG: sigma 54-interacting transcriptional regulator [Caloramator sp.]|nr:sigma 54-interacting transcriptional regulator [Caloramator sp.]